MSVLVKSSYDLMLMLLMTLVRPQMHLFQVDLLDFWHVQERLIDNA